MKLGEHMTEEQKEKRRGINNPFYGHHWSEEAKEKFRQARIGKKMSLESSIKKSLATKGKHLSLSIEQINAKRERMKGNKITLGRHHTEESKRKMREARAKQVYSDESRAKMSRTRTGMHPTEQTREKLRKRMVGNKYTLGRKLTEEHKNKISKSGKGRIVSQETRKKLHDVLIGKPGLKGDKNPRWMGGISWYPYTNEFNRQMKELIRDRDKHICQRCGIPEIELTRLLDIHHIDYQKWNCLPTNLISLCGKCHVSTNTNRTYWTNYFTTLLNRRTLKVVNK